MIREMSIKGYKSLDGLRVKLMPLSIIFGPNASGKSNFLDALQLISRMVSSRSLKNAFEPPYRGRPIESFSFSADSIQGLLAKESINFSFSIILELADNLIDRVNDEIISMRKGLSRNGSKEIFVKEKYLQYDLEIEFLPQKGFLRVKNEKLQALRRDLTAKNSRNPFLEKTNNRLSLRMEGQAHPTFYDIGLDHTILSLPFYPPHYPHLTAAKREIESWQFFYFEPRERMRAASPTKEVDHIGMMGEELAAFLHTLKMQDATRNKFIAIQRAVHTIIPSIDKIDTVVDQKTGEVELLVYENNIPIPSRLVSEGTLRILGLMSITGGNIKPTVVCFEEPENGIHPRRIKLIAEYLKNTADENLQIIVTTHSSLLPDLVDNKSLYVCRKTGTKSTIQPFSGLGLFRKNDIDEGLNYESPLPSELIMRGDLDA